MAVGWTGTPVRRSPITSAYATVRGRLERRGLCTAASAPQGGADAIGDAPHERGGARPDRIRTTRSFGLLDKGRPYVWRCRWTGRAAMGDRAWEAMPS